MAARKYLRNNAGHIAEESSIVVSTGVPDEGKIPALDTDGILDPTIFGGISSSGGSGSVGKVPILDASGKIDPSFLPVGIGADTQAIQASEALAAGDLVNVWDSAGSFRVRKADATTSGKAAHGFVLAAFASSASATVYFAGSDTAVSGHTPGYKWLSTTPGQAAAAAPSGSGNVVQLVGVATAATVLNFNSGTPITLA